MLDDATVTELNRFAADNEIEGTALCAVVDVESGSSLFANSMTGKNRWSGPKDIISTGCLPGQKGNIAVNRRLADRRAGKIRNPHS